MNTAGTSGMYSYNNSSRTQLTILEYVKAFQMEMIPADTVYQAMFETIGLASSMESLSLLVAEHLRPFEKNRLGRLSDGGGAGSGTAGSRKDRL